MEIDFKEIFEMICIITEFLIEFASFTWVLEMVWDLYYRNLEVIFLAIYIQIRFIVSALFSLGIDFF